MRTDAKEFAGSVRKWSFRGLVTLLDQGLISGSNFVVAILLARWLTPREYGAYALAFEVFLFLSIVYASLMLEPMSVFGSSVYKDDLRCYMGVLVRIHCVLSIVMAAGVFATAAALHALKPENSLPVALMGVSVATPCLLLFWLARRGFYVLVTPQKAVWGACSYSAVTLTGLLIVYHLRCLSPVVAFLIMTAGAAITAPAMLLWFKRQLPSSPGQRIQIQDVLRKHWNYGRWALASSAVIWFTAAVYYPLLGTFFGLAEAGTLKALMNLSSPIGQAFFAVSLLSLPHASRTNHERIEKGRSGLTWKLTTLYISGTCAYWLILIVLRNPVIHHLYGNRYQQITGLLPWLALGSILRIAASSQTIILKSMKSPELEFVAYSSACVVAIVFGIPAARWFGISGALSGWISSSGVALLVGARLVWRKSARSVGSPGSGPLALSAGKQRAMVIGG